MALPAIIYLCLNRSFLLLLAIWWVQSEGEAFSVSCKTCVML